MSTSELVERLKARFDPRIVQPDELSRAAAARLEELERENAALREACRQAAITFRFYEQSHLAKKTQDGDQKAHRNHEMAAMCEAALAGSGEK